MAQVKVAAKKQVPAIFPFTFNVKCIILLLLGFVFYANTLQNGYLLDDNLVIVENDYVQQGFSGIPKILSADSFDSFMKKTGLDRHKLSGGRYRPLSIVVFAIEHAIFGESPFMRHLVHILCFCLLLLVMFWFADKYVFKSMEGGDVAFLSVLLFAIHPIHTEVVANVKSLDEILSLLFILLTFIFSLNYIKHKKIKDLIFGLVTYFLALLSKEYGVALIVLLPVLFYLNGNKQQPLNIRLKEAILSSLPYSGSLVLYVVLRISAVGLPAHVVNNDVAINPYLYATFSQTIATKIFVLGKYFYMLFIPYPLSYDYNYAAIFYRNFADISVWVSILLYAGIIGWGGWLLFKKNILAFPVLFFLLSLALVSNFLLDIGATMGERLIFHSSMGFAMVLSYGVIAALKKIPVKVKQPALFVFLGLLIIVCGAETVKRNRVWNDFQTLTTTDVSKVPNSIMANDYAAMSYIFLANVKGDSVHSADNLRKAIACASRAVHVMKNYFDGYYRMGIAYSQLHIPDSAIYYLDMAKNINPNDMNLKKYIGNVYLSVGFAMGKRGDFNGAIRQMWKGITDDSDDADLWYNLGGAYYTAHKFDSAKYAWTKTLEIDPKNSNAANGLKAVSAVMGEK